MPIGLGLNPQNSDITSRYQPQMPQQPMMPVGNMFSQQSFGQPNMTGLRNPYQSTAQDEALYNRRQAVANDPINKGLGVLGENALKAMTPSNYLKVLGVPEEVAQVSDFIGPGEIKSLAALGTMEIKDFLQELIKSQKDDIGKSLKNINKTYKETPILGSYRLNKIEEVSKMEMARENIEHIHKYIEARSSYKPMSMAELAELKAEETRLLNSLKQYGTPEEMKKLREYNMFRNDSFVVAKMAKEPQSLDMKELETSGIYDRYLEGMGKYHYRKKDK